MNEVRREADSNNFPNDHEYEELVFVQLAVHDTTELELRAQAAFSQIKGLIPLLTSIQKRSLIGILTNEISPSEVKSITQQNAAATLNEIAVKEGKSPSYVWNRSGPDHSPMFSLNMSLIGYTVLVEAESKVKAKSLACANLVIKISHDKSQYQQLAANMIPPIDGWVADLTMCGDVEKNPGPNRINSRTFVRANGAWSPINWVVTTQNAPGYVAFEMSATGRTYNSVDIDQYGVVNFAQSVHVDRLPILSNFTYTITPGLTTIEQGSLFINLIEIANDVSTPVEIQNVLTPVEIQNSTAIMTTIDPAILPLPVSGNLSITPDNSVPTWTTAYEPQSATPKMIRPQPSHILTHDEINAPVLAQMKKHVNNKITAYHEKTVGLDAALHVGLAPNSVLGKWLKYITGLEASLDVGFHVHKKDISTFASETGFNFNPTAVVHDVLSHSNGRPRRRTRRAVRFEDRSEDKENHRNILLSGDVEENPGPESMAEIMMRDLKRIQAEMPPCDPEDRPTEAEIASYSIGLPTFDYTPAANSHPGKFAEAYFEIEGKPNPWAEQPEEVVQKPEPYAWNDEKLTQYILDKAAVPDNTHYQIIANIFLSNRFSVLETEDIDLDYLEDQTEAVQEEEKPKDKAPSPRGSSKPKLEDEERHRKRKQPKDDKAEVRISNALATEQRLLKRFSDPVLLSKWMARSPRRSLVTKMCSQKFGANWMEKDVLNSIEIICYGYISASPLPDILDKMLSSDDEFDDMNTHEVKYNAMLNTICSRLDTTCTAFELCRAASVLNNKRMHALNGNIVGMEDQKSVDAQPSFYSMLGTESHQPVVDELETLAQMTTQRNTINTVGAHINENDSIRSDVILADNTNRVNVQIPLPITDLVPRTFRQNDNTLANSGLRLQGVRTHVTDSYIAKAQPSDYSESLGSMVKEQKSSTWRATNTTSNGWNMFDVVQMNSTVTQKDLSMDQALTKLMLLYNIVSSNLEYTQIPSSIYSALDGRTQPTNNNPVLGFNNGPNIFGENSGGAAAPVFPYGGGNGTLAFHLTLQSVPVERRNNAIFVPSTALQGTFEGRRALAMYVMMFAKWPFCMHTVTKNTTDAAGGNPGDQVYIHTESLASVPGLDVMDIVLPRDASVVNPTAGGQANAVAMVQPSYGSEDAGQGGADALINISFVGQNGVIEINLTDYLCSWALDFSIGDIEQFITRLRYLLPIDRDLYAARQNALMLSDIVPHLLQSNADGTTQYVSNTTNSLGYSLANVTIPETTTVNWGADVNVQQNYQLLQTDILAHNKYVLGLFALPDVITSASLFGWLGHHSSFLCGLLSTLKITAVHNVFYSARRMTTRAWDEAYSSQWKGYQHAVYQMFSYNATQGSLHPAMIDNSIHNLYQNMFDESMPLATTYYRGEETKFSLFGRWMYPRTNGFATVYYSSGVGLNAKRNGEVPCNLIDAWIYKFSNQLPKCFLPWPTPLGQDSTQGYNKQIDPRLIVNWNSAGANSRPFMCRQYDESERLDTNVTVDIHDNTLWNVDIFVGVPNVQTVYYDSTAAAINTIPIVNFIKQRAMPINAAALRPTGTLDACNHTKPLVDHDGRLVYLQAPVQDAANTINAMLRVQQLARSAFRWGHVMRNAAIPTDRQGTMDEITKILMKNQGFRNARTTDPAPVQTQSDAAHKQMTVDMPQSIVQPTQHEIMDTQSQATVSTE